MNAEEIKKLGRKSIIKMAVEKLNQYFSQSGIKNFNPANFDRIKVMASKNSIYVTFGMTYQYVPLKSSFYYGVYINLTENMMSYGTVPNPKDYNYKEKPNFFIPTEESKKAISFVLDAINESDAVGSIPDRKLPEDTIMTIREKKDFFDIEVRSTDLLSHYMIKKKSCQIFNNSHEHLIHPDEDEEELFIEVKD